MSRKKYWDLGWIVIASGFIISILLICIEHSLETDFLNDIGPQLLFGFICAGVNMLANSKDEDTYKKWKIREKDERNQLIEAKAAKVALVVCLLLGLGVNVYIKHCFDFSFFQKIVVDMPFIIGIIAYGISDLVLQKKL